MNQTPLVGSFIASATNPPTILFLSNFFRKCSFLIFVIFLFFNQSIYGQACGPDVEQINFVVDVPLDANGDPVCPYTETSFVFDLSNDPQGDNECCGVPANNNCVELIVDVGDPALCSTIALIAGSGSDVLFAYDPVAMECSNAQNASMNGDLLEVTGGTAPGTSNVHMVFCKSGAANNVSMIVTIEACCTLDATIVDESQDCIADFGPLPVFLNDGTDDDVFPGTITYEPAIAGVMCNPDDITISVVESTLPDDCVGGTFTRTYTLEAPCQDPLEVVQTFTDAANLGPAITCPANEAITCIADFVAGTATATFTCMSGPGIFTTGAPVLLTGTADCPGATYSVTYTVEDACGAMASCDQIITIISALPTISCPAGADVECFADISVDAGDATTTVGCTLGSVVTVAGPDIAGPADCPGTTYTYTYTILDECGNSASCDQVFTIDNLAPTILCPADMTVECVANIIAGVPLTTASCGQGTLSALGPVLATGMSECSGSTYEIEYIFSDDCGRSASCIQTFTLMNAAPMIVCAADETVACFGDIAETAPIITTSCGKGSSYATVGPTLVGGTDLCDGAVYEIEYTVTDVCGETAACIQKFTLDVAPPMIVCAADETVACFDDIAETAPVTTISCGATSEVTTDGPTLESGTDLCDGAVYEIEYTVTDGCGVAASCKQTFTLDVAPPIIVCAADETVACFDDIAGTAPVTTISCGATSEVTTDGPTLVSGTDLCDGAVYEIEYTVTDGCGVVATCIQKFTLDVTPPMIVCAVDETVACFDDIAETAPVTTISCGAGSEVTTDGPTLVSGTDLCDGAVYEIVYTVTDDCGVAAACTQTFTLDVAPPMIVCAADETVACFEDIAETAPTVITSCGQDGTVASVGPTLVSGTDLCNGAVYEIVYTVTDDCGVAAACTQTFTLDVAPPTIVCAADETVACFVDIAESAPITTTSCGQGSAVATVGPTLVSGTDMCDEAVYEIIYTVTDECGVTAACTQTFTLDVAPPSIMCAADQTVSCFMDIAETAPVTTTSCGVGSGIVTTVGPTLVSGTDLCDGAVYEIEYTVTDDCSLTASCKQTFTLDVAPPTIVCAADETVACFMDIAESAPVTTISCGAGSAVTTVGPTLVSGTDLCDGAAYEIEYTVTDDCGVAATCIQTFTLDVAPPTIVCAADETVACFADIAESAPVTTISCGTGSAVTTEGPTLVSGTDLCDGAVYEIEYTVTDDCGVTATCIQTFTLDVAPPTIVCAVDETVACFADIAESAPVTTISCGQGSTLVTTGPSLVSGTDLCDGAVYEINYTVTDDCGVAASCIQTFTLDVAPPTIVCAADETVACFVDIAESTPITTASCGQGSTVATAGPSLVSGTDLCDGAVYEIVYTVTDDCGVTASCIQSFTLDVAPPTIVCAADETVACFVDIAESAPITTTSCGQTGTVTTVGPTLVSGPDLCDEAVYQIEYTVTDDCGVTASCIQTFTLDVAPPTMVCPADETVACFVDITVSTPVTTTSCGAGNAPATSVGPTLVSGTDMCDGAVYEIEYSVTDDCGLSASCIQTFTLDVAPPTMVCPADETVSCFTDISVSTPVTTTSCGAGNAPAVAVGPTLVSGADLCDGAVYQIEYTVTDDCGLMATCIQTFTLDVAPPTIVCAADETVSCFTDIAETAPLTTTSCGQGSTVTTVGPTLVFGADGCDEAQYTIEYTITDDCGVTASCIQTFTLDVAPPTIVCAADETVACFTDIAETAPVTTTSCGQGSSVATLGPSLVAGNAGCNAAVYQIVYTVTDDCGMTASCSQTFTLDVAGPTIACPDDLTVNCFDDISEETPIITTACGQGSTVTTVGPTLISGSDGCDEAQYTIEYTVTDDCGVTASCTQTFTLDVAGPTIECPADQTVNCFNDISVETPITTAECGLSNTVTTVGPTLISGSDGCDGAEYELVYTVTDDCGKTASCTQTFTLSVGPPIIPINQIIGFENLENGGTMALACVTTNEQFILPQLSELEDLVYAECGGEVVYELTDSYLGAGDCETDGYLAKYYCKIEATDECGSVSVFDFYLEIVDNNPPVFLALPDDNITVSCDDIPEPYDVIAQDECICVHIDMTETMLGANSQSCFDNVLLRTWTAEDHCGNISSFVQRINLIDDLAPQISEDFLTGLDDYYCPRFLPVLTTADIIECNEIATLDYDDVYLPTDCSNLDILVRSWLLWDECGNASTIPQYFYVLNADMTDAEPTFRAEFLSQFSLDTIIEVTSAELDLINSDPFKYTIQFPSSCNFDYEYSIDIRTEDLACDDGYESSISLVYNVQDPCGNITEYSFEINVLKAGDFGLSDVPEEIDIFCTEELPQLEIEGNDNFSLTEVITPGDCPNEYVMLRTFVVSDTCGLEFEFTQRINVMEARPVFPMAEVECSTDVQDEYMVQSPCSDEMIRFALMSRDTLNDCVGSIRVENSFVSEQTLCGNVFEQRVVQIISDTVAPEIIFENQLLSDIASGEVTTILASDWQSYNTLLNYQSNINQYSVFALDDCNDEMEVETNIVTKDLPCQFNEGVFRQFEFYWSAQDLCGNVTEINSIVDIVDDRAPRFGQFDPVLTYYCDQPVPPVPFIFFFDETETTTEFTITTVFSDEERHVINRKWTVSDLCGNVVELNQRVIHYLNFEEEDIDIVGDVICNTTNNIAMIDMPSNLNYQWTILGESCFITNGQNTNQIEFVVGYEEVEIIVEVSNDFGCSFTSSTIVQCESKKKNLIDEFIIVEGRSGLISMGDVKLLPNPARNEININLSNEIESSIIGQILDSRGKIIREIEIQDKSSLIDISDLQAGIYFLNLSNNKEIKNLKFIKVD